MNSPIEIDWDRQLALTQADLIVNRVAAHYGLPSPKEEINPPLSQPESRHDPIVAQDSFVEGVKVAWHSVEFSVMLAVIVAFLMVLFVAGQ